MPTLLFLKSQHPALEETSENFIDPLEFLYMVPCFYLHVKYTVIIIFRDSATPVCPYFMIGIKIIIKLSA